MIRKNKRRPVSVPYLLYNWRADFRLQGHWLATLEKHLRKHQLRKHCFWQILQHMLLVWPKPLTGKKRRVRKIHETRQQEKQIYFVQIWSNPNPIQAIFVIIGTGKGPFFAETQLITWKIQNPQNISPGLFLKFSAATVFPQGAC